MGLLEICGTAVGCGPVILLPCYIDEVKQDENRAFLFTLLRVDDIFQLLIIVIVGFLIPRK